mmetsp:Transcript_16515/g.44937  ORF Transcript_16515/g.44937 Transcript_16515/m.44937 type:complete len:84 (-) Transcript_16515:449-700(-)
MLCSPPSESGLAYGVGAPGPAHHSPPDPGPGGGTKDTNGAGVGVAFVIGTGDVLTAGVVVLKAGAVVGGDIGVVVAGGRLGPG